MVADRFNGLVLMYIYRELEPDISEVIKTFSAIGNHRLEFI